MHKNRGKTVAQCLATRTEYAKNGDKTNDGEYVSSYACDPATVDAEFLLTRREYAETTGREHRNEVIAYQLRQSFKPGEITPEEANRIGYELAKRFTKDRHAFIVATHTDKSHIHNHIIFNSVALDCAYKFRNFFGSSFAIRKLSDQICLEHGVSIIENPARTHTHYGQWSGGRNPPSQREELRMDIDAVLRQKPNSFSAFLAAMTAAGYEVKAGKHLAFRKGKRPQFIRLRTLGDGYDEAAIRAVIAGQATHKPRTNRIAATPTKRLDFLVDIQEKLLAGKGVGYERWAKKFNIKQMAQTLNYLSENKLMDYEKLAEKATEVSVQFHDLSEQVQTADTKLKALSELRDHIFQYRKTKDVYAAYRQRGYSKQFYEKHETEILLHTAAKAAFDRLPNGKVPSLKAIQTEFSATLQQKRQAYGAYIQAKREMQAVLIAKANVDTILDKETPKKERDKVR